MFTLPTDLVEKLRQVAAPHAPCDEHGTVSYLCRPLITVNRAWLKEKEAVISKHLSCVELAELALNSNRAVEVDARGNFFIE